MGKDEVEIEKGKNLSTFTFFFLMIREKFISDLTCENTLLATKWWDESERKDDPRRGEVGRLYQLLSLSYLTIWGKRWSDLICEGTLLLNVELWDEWEGKD